MTPAKDIGESWIQGDFSENADESLLEALEKWGGGGILLPLGGNFLWGLPGYIVICYLPSWGMFEDDFPFSRLVGYVNCYLVPWRVAMMPKKWHDDSF